METQTQTDLAPHAFGDVPLEIAMIGWTPTHHSRVGVPGRVAIIPQNNDRKDYFKWLGVTDSSGAVWSEWGEMDTKQRLMKLYIEAWHMVCRDGISPKTMHQALMVIPEYRDTLSGETFFSWRNPTEY
jgi:hypothetical protein